MAKKIGTVLAVFHFAGVLYIVYCIFFQREPDWPMYWLIFFALDFPLLILCLPAGALLSAAEFTKIPGVTSPSGDILNFWLPLVILGAGGTVWWYFLPRLFRKLFFRRLAA